MTIDGLVSRVRGIQRQKSRRTGMADGKKKAYTLIIPPEEDPTARMLLWES